MATESADRKPLLQIVAPQPLVAAVKVAANHQMTSISEYVRRAVIERLQRDGVAINRDASAA